MRKRKKLAVLVSGRGSNLQALLDACADPAFPAEIAVVVSNIPGAYALDRAQQAGVATEVCSHKNYDGKAAFEAALIDKLAPYHIDLVCLAGFMRILSPVFLAAYPNRVINIHPSLLPLYKGLDTHARALADNAREGGCTVHLVIPEMDAGPIIVQKSVAIAAGETPDSLAAKVLEQEHIAYVEAVRAVCEGTVDLDTLALA
jgi:phosphoribosylglycinamide formyltransferase-1